MNSSNLFIIPNNEVLVEGTMNFWYTPIPTPPTTLPTTAPTIGIGINIYPAIADPTPIEVFTPKLPKIFNLFYILKTLFENVFWKEYNKKVDATK